MLEKKDAVSSSGITPDLKAMFIIVPQGILRDRTLWLKTCFWGLLSAPPLALELREEEA